MGVSSTKNCLSLVPRIDDVAAIGEHAKFVPLNWFESPKFWLENLVGSGELDVCSKPAKVVLRVAVKTKLVEHVKEKWRFLTVNADLEDWSAIWIGPTYPKSGGHFSVDCASAQLGKLAGEMGLAQIVFDFGEFSAFFLNETYSTRYPGEGSLSSRHLRVVVPELNEQERVVAAHC